MADTAQITVESHETAGYAEGAITITKPTGLAVDDLMVAVLGLANSETASVPSGWTALANTVTWGLSNLECAILYKTADSGDAAASNFSFDVSDGTGSLCGTLFRISGQNTDDEFTTPDEGSDTSTGSSRSHTVSLTPEQSDSVLIAAMGAEPNSSMNVSSVSSTGSPSWTEVQDAAVGAGVFWVGYTAGYTGTGEITNFSASLNETTNRSDVVIFAVRSKVDSTGTSALLSTSPTFLSGTGSADVNATSALLSSSPTFLANSGTGTAPTTWSNASRPSLSQTRLNAVYMDGDNKVYMDGDNKVYREADTRDWVNETRP